MKISLETALTCLQEDFKLLESGEWVPEKHSIQASLEMVSIAQSHLPKKSKKAAWGLLFNKNAWWIGMHYSPRYKRYCINLIPCVTIWYVKKGGVVPKRSLL